MKQVLYPDIRIINYLQLYKNIFSVEIGIMQKKWKKIRNGNTSLHFLPVDIKKILIADYSKLVSWYVRYSALPSLYQKKVHKQLSDLFDYDKWCTIIAEYFRNPQNGFNISTCHYCETAYINSYKIDPIEDAIYFLNAATADELKKKLKVSDNSINYLISQRPFLVRADFDNVANAKGWKTSKFDDVFKPNNKYRHHFDLDHVLPKSRCPFVALSLYNFVPSCQICNQKLKKTKVLGHMGIPSNKISPTSSQFDFDGNVHFTIVPKPGTKIGIGPLLQADDYLIRLQPTDPDYEIFIKLFKLDERYDYHKRIALQWLELKIKYSDARIHMMANALHHASFSFKRIKDDIFQNNLYNEGKMAFTKLRKDMLK